MSYEDLMEEYKNGVGTTTFEEAGIHCLYNNGMENHRNEIKQKMMTHGQRHVAHVGHTSFRSGRSIWPVERFQTS